MELRDVINHYPCIMVGSAGLHAADITYDSRQVKPETIFVAIRGGHSDGHEFIPQAIGKGAPAIVYEQGRDLSRLMASNAGRAWVGVADCRDALAALAASLFGHPSRDLTVVGLTGTNGKTTTSYFIKSVLEAGGAKTGLIGTIRYMIGEESFDAPHTTPEASDFQRLLASMRAAGCSHVVSEVSSHALDQRRADHSSFRVAVFTNLTQDHLDYHGTMERYYEAKARLFLELLADGGTAVINIDDPYGRRLAAEIRNKRGASVNQLTFSMSDPSAVLFAESIGMSFRGASFIIKDGRSGAGTKVSTRLVGQTSVLNALAAFGAGIGAGIAVEDIIEGIAGLGSVKGRFERVDQGQKFLVVIDYAHTEDALERLLATARRLLDDCRKHGSAGGRLITVFGCGGNRDTGKRPRMGAVAGRLSDQVVVTTDNPRFEEPLAIIRDIERGMTGGNYVVMPDRSLAIGLALRAATPGDIVVVAGKGHEEYQEIRGERHPFSDRRVIEEALLAAGWNRKIEKTAAGEVCQ